MRTFLLKAVLTAAMIIVIVTQIDLAAVLARFAALPFNVIMLCLAIAFAQIVALTYRWSLVCRVTGIREPFGQLLRSMMVCQFFSQGLPASVGGDALRVWWLNRLGVSLPRAAKNVLTDRVAGLIALLVLNAFAVLPLTRTVDHRQIIMGALFLLAAGAAGIALIASRRGRRLTVWALLRLRRSSKVRRRRTALVRWFVSLQTSVARLFRIPDGVVVLLWGIAIHLHTIILCLILVRQAGYDLSLFQLTAVIPSVMLISYLPISIGSWGVREGGMLLALGLLGMPANDAVFVGVALGAFGFASAVAGALIWFFAPMPDAPHEHRP